MNTSTKTSAYSAFLVVCEDIKVKMKYNTVCVNIHNKNL